MYAIFQNLVLLQRDITHKGPVITEGACKLLLPRVSFPKQALQNGSSKTSNGDTATIRTIRSHRSQSKATNQRFHDSLN